MYVFLPWRMHLTGTDAFAPVLKTHLDAHGVALSSPVIEGVPTGVCIVLSGTVRHHASLWCCIGSPTLVLIRLYLSGLSMR